MRRRRGWLTPLLLVIGLAGACGDQDDADQSNESVTASAGDNAASTTTSTAAALPAREMSLHRDTVFVVDGPRLWRVDPETGERSAVIELGAGEQIRSAIRSNDGEEVLVVSERSEPPTSTLWIARVDEASPTQLIHLEGETRITSARLSPDGDRVLTVRESRVNYGANLFVTSRARGEDVQLTDLPDDEPIQNPSIHDEQFSPDGQAVLFGVYDWASDTTDLFAVSVDGSAYRSLTSPDDLRSAHRALFATDGSNVVYQSTADDADSPATDIFRMPLAGGEATRLTDTSDDETARIEALHPDGTTLLVSLRDLIVGPGIAGGRLLLLDLDRTERRSVFSAEDGETLGRADFVLDGSAVLFNTTRDQTDTLFTLDLGGTDRTAITDPDGWVVSHDVSPSGARVLYRTDGDTTTSLLDLRTGTVTDIAGDTVFFSG